MTKGDPLASRRRLADMSQPQTPFEYSPPVGGDTHEYVIQLEDEHQLHVRMNVYRGNVVDFAIVQLFIGSEFPVEIARVDCCHGEVHMHQFGRRLGEVSRTVIERIPEDEPWKTVDRLFEACNDEWNSAEAWERRYRSWEKQ